MHSLIKDLKARNLINNITNEEKLIKALEKNKGIYVGFDPSADSLHLGNYIMIMLLKRFRLYNIKTLALVGGATGMIGDPSGKSAERNLLDKTILEKNIAKIKFQLEKFTNSQVINNYVFYENMTFLDFLRDVGKLININYLLEKEIINSRLSVGISYTEFSYNLLQGYDFLQLYKNDNIAIQAGGSDQWGNITSGIDLIHRLEGNDRPAFGLTIPLMLKADGTKFGKSAGGAVWLDPEKTSPYEFYQFWINQDDRDVVKYLKYFTFLSKEEIDELAEKVQKEPWKREAQRRLAEEVTKFVHGEAGLKEAQMITDALFSGNVKDLSVKQIEQALKNAPSAESTNEKQNLVEFLVDTKIESSKRQAREDIQNGAIYVNGDKIQDLEFEVDPSASFEGKYVIIRKGKRK